MPIEVRPPTEEELPEYFRTISVGFANTQPVQDEAAQEAEAALWELDRTHAAFDDGRIVGGTSAYSFQMALPGGTTAPTAGVTGVAVLPTHRRQGILTRLMRSQLDEVVERGDVFAALNASEAQIYGRFGYGPADRALAFELATERSAFSRPPEVGGRVRLVPLEEALELIPPVYEAHRPSRPGELDRSPGWWAIVLGRVEGWKGGGPQFFAVHEDDDGAPDGYARYATDVRWAHGGLSEGTLTVRELVGTTPEVEAALWRYCCDVDLVTRLVGVSRPLDDHLPWRLADQRQLRVTSVADRLWVRLVDVAAGLAARRYGVDDELTIEVTDPFRPENDGCYRLDGGPEGASCERTGDPPALRLDAAALGALVLGGPRFSTLARARRVEEVATGALTRADRMFASARSPLCTTTF